MLLPRLIVCFVVGIISADALFEVVSGGTLYLFLGAVCAFLIAVVSWRGRRIFCIALALAFFLLGGALLVNERRSLQVAWSGEEKAYCATHLTNIREKAKSYQVDALIQERKVRLTLRKDSFSALPKHDAKLLLYAQVRSLQDIDNLGTFDYANYLMRQGFSGTAFCHRGAWEAVSGDDSTSFAARLATLRNDLTLRLERHLDGASLEVANAMTLGNKHMVSKETRMLYSQTGASHVLALSGLHLSLLFALFNLLLLRPLRPFRRVEQGVQLLFLLAMWGFVMMVGSPLSLLRAAVMLTVVQLSVLFQRNSLSLHNLALAALVLLIGSPQSLFDVGFQLSFMAVLGIVVIMPHLPQWRPLTEPKTIGEYAKKWGIDFVQGLLRVSLSAQIGTLPLVLYYFHLFPTYALLISLWVIPLAGIVLTLALLFFLFPFAESVLDHALCEVLRWLNAGLDAFSNLPFATFEMPITLPTAVLLYSLIPLILWGMGNFKRRMKMLIGVGVIILCIGVIEMWTILTAS